MKQIPFGKVRASRKKAECANWVGNELEDSDSDLPPRKISAGSTHSIMAKL